MICFENIKKQYKDGFVALKKINFKVNKGELLTLIGPSGCGKTTTMRMINRLIEPTKGKITINENDISKVNPVELRRSIGYVIQQIGLFPHMTIEENISLVPKLKKWKQASYLKRVNELLDLVGLNPDEYKDRYPYELSGGQQQRVGVIRALSGKPEIILMDEPFSALDPLSREQLQNDIVKLQKEIHKTIVFVTHDMDEALKISSRIILMKEGEIVQNDVPEQILSHPANEFVRSFMGEVHHDRNKVILPTALYFMKKEIVTISPQHRLPEAARLMKDKGLDTLFVIDQLKKFRGVVTLRKINQYAENNNTTLISDIIEPAVGTLTENASLKEIAKLFSKTSISAIPVLKDKKLVGVITRSGFLKALAD